MKCVVSFYKKKILNVFQKKVEKKPVKLIFFFFFIQRKHGGVVGHWNGAQGVFFKSLFSKQMVNQDDYHQKTLPLQSCSYRHYIDYDDKRQKKSIPYWSFGCLQKNTWMFFGCVFPFFGGWVTQFKNIWGDDAVVITWQQAPPPCCEMDVAYRKSPYLWLWGLGAETSSYYKADHILFTEFVEFVFVYFLPIYIFFFPYSGFKYFFIQRRESLCSWKKEKSKTAQTIYFRYLEMHECDCWCFKSFLPHSISNWSIKFEYCFRNVEWKYKDEHVCGVLEIR